MAIISNIYDHKSLMTRFINQRNGFFIDYEKEMWNRPVKSLIDADAELKKDKLRKKFKRA